jgi:tetratricopeptide (TPR) repeat protein
MGARWMASETNSTPQCDDLFQNFSSSTLRLAQESIDRTPQVPIPRESAERGDAEWLDLETALIRLGCNELVADASGQADQFVLGKFKVFAERGRGGFGIVLQAFDPDLQREVALKLPLPERILQGEDPEEALREARVAAKLAHPGIVPVFETGQWGPVWYIASAYCSGPSLREWLVEKRTVLSAKLIACLTKRICEIVGYAHSRGVLHLDLKPDNILLEQHEETHDVPLPLLTDFGLAKRSTMPEEVGQRRPGGTIHYMAPEQRAGEEEKIGVWTDVYALGAILRDLLWAHDQAGIVDSPRRYSGSLDDLYAVARKCLAEDIEERYASAQDIAADLDRYLSGEVLHARPVAWPTRISRWVRRKPSLALASMLLTLLVLTSVITIGLLWRQAEANLARFIQADKNNEVANQKIEESVLNLAWVAQKARLGTVPPAQEFAGELKSLKNFLLEMQDWSANRRQDTQPSPGLSAALQSLALIDGIESQSTFGIERSFHNGLADWQQLIAQSPHDVRWHKALAAHILTYEMQRPERTWLDWRLPGRGLEPEIIQTVEPFYAELLIDQASQQIARRSFDPSHSMLRAAIELLESQGSSQVEATMKARLLLTSFNLTAQCAAALSRAEEAKAYFVSARKLAATMPPPKQCDPDVAFQVSQTLKVQSRELWTADKHGEAIDLLALAIRYCARSASAGEPSGAKYRELSHLNGRMARDLKDVERLDEAVAAYVQAVQYLNQGLALLGRPRSFISLRATFQSELGCLLLRKNQLAQAVQVLTAADRDFVELKLRRVDSKSTWFASVRTLQALGLAYKQLGNSDESFDAYIASLQQLNLMSSFTNHPRINTHARISKIALAQLNEPSQVTLTAKRALPE